MSARPIPPRIEAIFRNWSSQVQWIRGLYAGLVITAVAGSVLAAAGVGKKWLGVENLLSLVAAVAVSLVSAFDLRQKANGFRRAWRILHAAMIRFESEAKYSEEELIKAYERAEEAIGDVTGVTGDST